jgi:hypothetical protein
MWETSSNIVARVLVDYGIVYTQRCNQGYYLNTHNTFLPILFWSEDNSEHAHGAALATASCSSAVEPLIEFFKYLIIEDLQWMGLEVIFGSHDHRVSLIDLDGSLVTIGHVGDGFGSGTVDLATIGRPGNAVEVRLAGDFQIHG